MLGACRDEGVQVVGGHTMVGSEPLLGLTVVGRPGCEPPLRKSGARSGDLLFLSKPVGSALALHAHGLKLLERDSLDESLSLMQLSNRQASKIAVSAGASAATDVTGFGLLGHLAEMLSGQLGAELILSTIPIVGVVRGLSQACTRLESLRANLAYARDRARLTGLIEGTALAPLLAPETNGPLLVAAPESSAARFAKGGFTQVGRVTSTPGVHIHP
jgi:selenide,water dikinase